MGETGRGDWSPGGWASPSDQQQAHRVSSFRGEVRSGPPCCVSSDFAQQMLSFCREDGWRKLMNGPAVSERQEGVQPLAVVSMEAQGECLCVCL